MEAVVKRVDKGFEVGCLSKDLCLCWTLFKDGVKQSVAGEKDDITSDIYTYIYISVYLYIYIRMLYDSALFGREEWFTSIFERERKKRTRVTITRIIVPYCTVALKKSFR